MIRDCSGVRKFSKTAKKPNSEILSSSSERPRKIAASQPPIISINPPAPTWTVPNRSLPCAIAELLAIFFTISAPPPPPPFFRRVFQKVGDIAKGLSFLGIAKRGVRIAFPGGDFAHALSFPRTGHSPRRLPLYSLYLYRASDTISPVPPVGISSTFGVALLIFRPPTLSPKSACPILGEKNKEQDCRSASAANNDSESSRTTQSGGFSSKKKDCEHPTERQYTEYDYYGWRNYG